MRSAITSAILILSVPGWTSAIGRELTPITKREARTLSAQQVERRVMAQLSAIIAEERWERGKPPVRPLTEMSFATKPRSTLVPGLCRVDRLRVSFRAAEQGESDADTPMLADGFGATHHFYFREAPKSHHHDVVDHDSKPDLSACDEVSWAKHHFFNADDEEAATNGYFLAHRVLDEILKGPTSYAVECDKLPIEKDRPCVDIVRTMNGAPVDAIEECEAREPEFASCYEIYIGDRHLRVVASSRAYGPNALPPFTPLKVNIGALIIMSHERLD